MSSLRARCPNCRTFTAVAIGDGYECHSCGSTFSAGLVRVVRTRKVRALTEKYYGRVARLFVLKGDESMPKELRGAAYVEIQRLICEEQPPKPSTVLKQLLTASSSQEPTPKSKILNPLLP